MIRGPFLASSVLLIAILAGGCDRFPKDPAGQDASERTTTVRDPSRDEAGAKSELARGRQLFATGDPLGARAAFEAAVAKDPSLADAHYWLGRACTVTGKAMSYSRALESYARALELDPGLVEAHWGLGLAHVGLAHSEDARRELETYLAEGTGRGPPEMHGEAEHFLGVLARERGATDEALAHCERAQALHPRFAETPYERGLTLESAGREDDALVAFRAAIRLDRSHLPSHFRLARLCRKRGLAEEAAKEERIHKLLNLLTDDSSGRTVRAAERRAELWGELATIDPLNFKARLEYARAIAELQREGEAALLVDELVRAAPELPEQPVLVGAYVLRAELALRARDEKTAAEMVAALVRVVPGLTAAHLPPSLRGYFPER